MHKYLHASFTHFKLDCAYKAILFNKMVYFLLLLKVTDCMTKKVLNSQLLSPVDIHKPGFLFTEYEH